MRVCAAPTNSCGRSFGHQHWWPGETPFEVCVGRDSHAEHGVDERRARHRQSQGRARAGAGKIVRVAGGETGGVDSARRLFQRQGAAAAVVFARARGRIRRRFGKDFRRVKLPAVRERLLAIHGVGPETADSMLLYAGGHHSFVIDAYTKRIFQRHGWSRKVDRPSSRRARQESKVQSQRAITTD